MPNDLAITSIAHVIQLAVAPVFLLTGISGLLAVLTNRVGRIVDRARQLAENSQASPAERGALVQRAQMANWAISLCTICALLICTLIVVLFVGAYVRLDITGAIALLFVSAMIALIIGLLCFLREIHLAIAGHKFLR